MLQATATAGEDDDIIVDRRGGPVGIAVIDAAVDPSRGVFFKELSTREKAVVAAGAVDSPRWEESFPMNGLLLYRVVKHFQGRLLLLQFIRGGGRRSFLELISMLLR